MIAEITRKREMEKLHQAMDIKDLVDNVLLTHESGLRMVFEKIQMCVFCLVSARVNC
jgi:hypothetical protein